MNPPSSEADTASIFDIPIGSSGEDRLDRKGFAKLVARAILAEPRSEPAVFAVNGAWGTGKSSVAEMIIELVVGEVELVRFEPWLVNSQELLVGEFFSTLGDVLFSDQNPRARELMRSYATKLAKGGAALALAAFGAVAVVTLPGALGAAAGVVASKASEKIPGSQPEAPLSLKQLKSQIVSDAIGRTGKPILVLIDDLDRLSHEEIRIVLQLIKACANFPNVRYLLLYDRVQVCAALKDTVGSPDAFLEKIVNQAFDLPEATSAQREKVLNETLSRLDLGPELGEEESRRYRTVIEQVLLPGLFTVRHVKRYVSTVSSLLPGVAGNGFRKVDIGDFLALEFLRQYVPTLYECLRNEQAPQPGSYMAKLLASHGDKPENPMAARTPIIEKLDQPVKELATFALKNLFDTEADSPRADANRRFAGPFWRPAYLGFSESRAGVAQARWQKFRKSLCARDVTAEWISELDEPSIRDLWGASIIARHMELSWPECCHLLRTLLVWGDTCQYDGGSWQWFMQRVSETILLEPDDADPAAELLAIGKETGSVVALGFLVGHESDNAEHRSVFSWSRGHKFAGLLRFAKRKFRDLLDGEAVWERPDLVVVGHTAHYLLGQKRWDQFREDIAGDPRRVERYLVEFIGDKSVSIDNLESKLSKAIRELDPATISDLAKFARLHYLRNPTESRRTEYRSRPKRPGIR